MQRPVGGRPDGRKEKEEDNVENVLEKLRSEMRLMSSSLHQSKDRAIRKSVSVMESQLAQNSEAFENHMVEVNVRHRKDVEKVIQQYEDTANRLKEQMQDKDNMIDQLKGRLEECRTAKRQALMEMSEASKYYNDRVKELEHCIADSKEKLVLLERERERRKSEISKGHGLEAALEESRSEIQSLENKLEVVENELKQRQYTIDQLEAAKHRLESSIEALNAENSLLTRKLEKYVDTCKTQVESDDSVRKVLEEQLAKIQSDWDETKKLLILEQVRSNKLEEEMKDVHREFGLVKVDLRIATRQKKQLETKLESQVAEHNAILTKSANIQEESEHLKSTLSSLHSEISALKSEVDTKSHLHASIVALQEGLKDQNIQLEADNVALKNELALLKMKENENKNLKAIIVNKDSIISEKSQLIEQKNIRIKSLQNSLEMLKEASSVLDAQLRDFEVALDDKLTKLKDAENFKELLENENVDLRGQLKKCKIEINEAKSMKAFTERRLQVTESTLKTQSESKETEVHAVLEKLNEATRRNEELLQEATSLMTQVSQLESEKFELRKNLEAAKSDKDRLMKELNVLMTTVVDIKDENLQLTTALKEVITKAESYKEKFESSQQSLNELTESTRTKELMFNTRIEQQEKLIEYLRQQLAIHQDKKKKKGIFTPKRNEKDAYTPKAGTPLTRFGLNVAQAQKVMTPLCLEEEQLAVKKLEQKRANLRSQLDQKLEEKRANLYPKFDHVTNYEMAVTKKTPTLPPPKREECVLLREKFRTLPTPLGKPLSGASHKFYESRCQTTEKCVSCRDPIYKGRPISLCANCKYSYHLACAAAASKTCGLSEEFAYELEKSVSILRHEPISDDYDNDTIMGSVKVRTEKMQTASKRFLKIKGNAMEVYRSATDAERGLPLESFPLNEYTKVFFRIEDNDDHKKSSDDKLAFAMKVVFYSEESQQKFVYMFHCNKNQKRYWTRGILKYSQVRYLAGDTTCSSETSFTSDEDKENCVIKPAGKVLLEDHREKRIYVNCVHWLAQSRVYLLGCDDGLYSLKTMGAKPVKIEGPKAIYQIDVLGAAKSAVFIEGTERNLTTVYIGLLKSCAEAAECSNPKFQSEIVAQTKDCYIFVTRSKSLKDTVVATASSNSLLLCSWAENGLTLMKQILMKDSITTLLMAEHSVLFGNHNVYEVDTKTFEIEEFLDMADESIYYVKIINESHGSYPVAILDVTSSRGTKTTEPEYLICFQDIGIFVDSFGRRSRYEDILWSKVPISFEYRHPFLYIFHFTSVEMQKLDAKSYTRETTVAKPSSVGEKAKGIQSRGIVPVSRFFQVTSKASPNYVGKGETSTGIVYGLSEAHSIKILELTAS